MMVTWTVDEIVVRDTDSAGGFGNLMFRQHKNLL
jgi:hypothetical protein